MNIIFIADQITKATDLYFHRFEQEGDVIIARSHFLDFKFYDDKVDVELSYVYPNQEMIEYAKENLPLSYTYNNLDDLNKFLETLSDIHHFLYCIEYNEEHRPYE